MHLTSESLSSKSNTSRANVCKTLSLSVMLSVSNLLGAGPEREASGYVTELQYELTYGRNPGHAMALAQEMVGKFHTSESYFLRSKAFLMLGDRLSALSDAEKAITLAKNNREIWLHYLDVLVQNEKYDEAIHGGKRMCEIFGESGDIYALLGKCYHNSQKHAVAIECYEKALTLGLPEIEKGDIETNILIAKLVVSEQENAVISPDESPRPPQTTVAKVIGKRKSKKHS